MRIGAARVLTAALVITAMFGGAPLAASPVAAVANNVLLGKPIV